MRVVWKLADEPDRIGKHDRVPASQIEPAQSRIEGGEQSILGEDAGAGEPVEHESSVLNYCTRCMD